MAEDDSKYDLLGYTIDKRYYIEKLLGQGGFGYVFQGKHLILGEPIRDIAIKIIKKQIDRGKEKEIFAEALMQVAADDEMGEETRERLVRIYDFGVIEEKNRLGYIIMEMVTGGDLTSELKRFGGQPMPESIANRYIKEIATGLAGLHSLQYPIIHRDLKPDNVLLTQNKKIKLADFGLAARLNNIYHWAEGVAGTQIYMAPETLQGYAFTQSDIFCLGVIWYQLLTNQMPFKDQDPPSGKEDGNAAKWRYQLRSKIRPDPISTYNNTCSESTMNMVHRCLEFKHTDRFRDARELENALQQKKMSREDCLEASKLALHHQKFQKALDVATQGLKADSDKRDHLQFKLKGCAAKAAFEIKNWVMAAELCTELRQENEKMRWIIDKQELLALYHQELEVYQNLGNQTKIRILTRKINES